jgi:hypothetical protein
MADLAGFGSEGPLREAPRSAEPPYRGALSLEKPTKPAKPAMQKEWFICGSIDSVKEEKD